MFTRPIERSWGHWHPVVHVTGGCGRPLAGGRIALADEVASMDGPAFKGMDPSDPDTWVRPWNPAPGMIGYLNFDGAAQQGRTPTGGVQRGSQRRGARGSR
jgi:hypothetical protein